MNPMNLLLRELRRSDLPAINRWRNDRAVTDQLGAGHRFVGEEVDEQWFDNYLKSRNANVRLAICDAAGQEPVGVVYLLNIDWISRSAEFAIQIGAAERRGSGIGHWATMEMLRHGFRDLNLQRIYLTVVAHNEAAMRLYLRAGFAQEGRMRKAAFKNGVYADMMMMAILADEFAAPSSIAGKAP